MKNISRNKKHIMQIMGQTIHVWYIFAYLPIYIYVDFYGVHVGKYTSPMDPMGGTSKPPDVAPFGHCPVVHPVVHCVHRAGPGILRAFWKTRALESIDWR